MADLNLLAIPALTVQGKAWRVIRFELDERLSELPVLACEVYEPDEILPPPGDLLDQPATFTLTRADGVVRSFVGSVVGADHEPDDDGVPTLHLVIAPALWNLTKRASCQIFQQMSAVDIVKKVLVDAGVPAAQQDWRLGGQPATRVYTVQYRETDLDFVQRLLFEEGIYYAVHVKDGKDVLVLGDAPDGLGDVEGATSLPFREDFSVLHEVADTVVRVSRTLSVQSDKVFVRDYDPDKPSLKLEGSVEGKDPGAHDLEIYEYPARCETEAAAKAIAQILLDSAQAERDVVHAETGSLTLLPGLRVSVEDHPYDPLNQEYLVIRSRIAGSSPRTFGAAPRAPELVLEMWGVPTKTTKYRPPRRLRERIVHGAQTAITTGPSGQEIHTDAGGHVKVSFHWDRSGKTDDTSSRWIRTSQLATGGSMLLPRMGWEVTARHLEGDADRPIVFGRMYNAVKPPPYALPANAARGALQTATTPGGGSSNEVRTADTAGSEEMFFNASHDMTTHVKNNATLTIGNDQHRKVGSNQKRSVTDSVTTNIGVDQSISVTGNQTIHVATFMVDDVDDHSLTIGGKRDMKVGGDHKRDVGGKSALNVDGKQIDLVVGSITDQTLAGFTHKVGDALVQLALKDRVVTVGGDIKEHAGAAKVIAVKGGRGVEVGGSMNVKTIGAVVNMAKGDHAEKAGGNYTEVAVGAQLVKAKTVSFEADTALTVVMGASILSLTPASVAILGLSAKLDGDVADTAVLILDN